MCADVELGPSQGLSLETAGSAREKGRQKNKNMYRNALREQRTAAITHSFNRIVIIETYIFNRTALVSNIYKIHCLCSRCLLISGIYFFKSAAVAVEECRENIVIVPSTR